MEIAAAEKRGGSDLRVELFEWARAFCGAIVVFVLLFAFVARVIGVQGTSMETTLSTGDQMLISNLFYTPARGDIVMFTRYNLLIPGHNMGEPLVKRVIAVGGDEVNVNAATQTVKVKKAGSDTWETLDEPYVKGATSVGGDSDYPVTVPEGYVFVMGDNRAVSYDSRYREIGMIDERELLGRVIMRIAPFNKFGPVR